MRNGTALLFAALMVLTATGCAKKPDSAPDSGGGVPSGGSVSDRDRLQGVWIIESKDEGDFKREAGMDRGDRFQFQGDQLIRIEAKDDPGERFSLTLDPSKDPKWMTLIRLDSSGKPIPATPKHREPLNEEWIYRFDGEALIVAESMTIEKSSRPTEFKARALSIPKFGQPLVPSVTLWQLKKTNEPFFQPVPPRPPPAPHGGTGK
jgi:uncharacterized protein (TIGR03067 family)